MQKQMQKVKFLINRIKSRHIILFIGLGTLAVFVIGVGVVVGTINKTQKEKADQSSHLTIPPMGPYVPDEVVVKFRDGFVPVQLDNEIEQRQKRGESMIGKVGNSFQNASLAILQEVTPEEKKLYLDLELKKAGVVSYKKLYDNNSPELVGFYTLFLQEGSSLPDTQKRLSELPFLASSEPNSIGEIFVVPNDPSYSQLWGMQKIQMESAWDITTGSTSIIVAVVDTGADLSHPDLAGSLVAGYDVAGGDTNPSDDNGHGTHVSGTIGGIGNNNVGVAGVNWNVKIMPVKVCNSGGSCPTSTVTQGIVWAADNGAKVINMSLGGRAVCPSGSQYDAATRYAVSKGVTVVVAAGNDSSDASGYSPASCSGTITVGASTPSDARASFSNYGAAVDIAAPGSGIFSTYPGGYKSLQGTSMASPHVAGAAALLLSVNPGLSPQQVQDCLVQNADAISASPNIGPRLNMIKTLRACSSGVPLPTPTGVTVTTGPTPTPLPGGVTPTGTPVSPGPTAILTPTPTPSAELPPGDLTPTPTPQEYFDCRYDPVCANSGKSLQLCPLICTPI